MSQLKLLWDAKGTNGRNRIRSWADSARLSSRDRAALNHRFHMLESMDYDLAIGTKVLNGPLKRTKGIYKLKAFGDHALRPMLCLGPVDAAGEYTILEGATEPNTGSIIPSDVQDRAIKTRDYVKAAPAARRQAHEHF